jgi:superfamily II DNA helicase RecQ
VATRALGTGVNIAGIAYVLYVNRPYKITSFVQQFRREGRNEEVSDSVVFVGVKTTCAWQRAKVVSVYTVKQVDKDALTAYLQAWCCWRIVLAGYINGLSKAVDCEAIDGISCDYCTQVS